VVAPVKFFIVRRGYYWLGPVDHGFCISKKYAWPFYDRVTAEEYAKLLNAEVQEVPESDLQGTTPSEPLR
jgi:hypothetical protein